jgi:hypothetical protein
MAAATKTEAGHGGNDRLGLVGDRLRGRVDCLLIGDALRDGAAHGAELGDVGADAEMAAGAGQDDGAQRLVTPELAEQPGDFLPHGERERVAPAGTGQRHDRGLILPC